MIQKNHQSKEVTIQKIKNLINLKPIKLTNDGLPATPDDFDELFDRLSSLNGGAIGIELSDEEINQLYENMVSNQGDPFKFEIEGQVFDNFEDLVDYE